MKHVTQDTDWYKYIKIGEHVTVDVQKEYPEINNKFEVRINWTCIGATTIEKTEEFIKELQEALNVAREEKISHDKKK